MSLPGVLAASGLSWVKWSDPIEGAFTLDVPAGWQVVGGTRRPIVGDPRFIVNARSSDETMQIFMGDEIPGYLEPEGLLSPLPEGSACAPGLVVKRFRTGEEYAREDGLDFFKRLTGRPVELQMSQPDPLAESLFPRQGLAPGVCVSAGLARFSIFWLAGPMVGPGVGMILATVVRNPVPNGPGGIWVVPMIHRILVTAARADELALAVWRLMCSSFAVDPRWTAKPRPRDDREPAAAGPRSAGVPQSEIPRGVVSDAAARNSGTSSKANDEIVRRARDIAGRVSVNSSEESLLLDHGKLAQEGKRVAPMTPAEMQAENEQLRTALAAEGFEIMGTAALYRPGTEKFTKRWPLGPRTPLDIPFDQLDREGQFYELSAAWSERRAQGHAALTGGRPEEAESIFRECLERADQMDVDYLRGQSQLCLARVARNRGDLAAERRCLVDAGKALRAHQARG